MSAGLPVCVVDAFTTRPFTGNPAAVVQLPGPSWPEPAWMQALAAELRLSETAFVLPRPDLGAQHADLRWFTPTVEVDLCGHATLAATHVLDATGTVHFATRSGTLTCERHTDGLVEIDLPGDRLSPVSATTSLAHVLRTNELYEVAVGRFLVVELGSGADVRTLQPDLAGVASLHDHGVVTAPGDVPGVDVVSRVFVPRMGIPEDPVTGSAHSTLATFWCERLGRDTFTAEQASPRGGLLRVRRAGDRVVLGGRAVTVWQGTLLATP